VKEGEGLPLRAGWLIFCLDSNEFLSKLSWPALIGSLLAPPVISDFFQLDIAFYKRASFMNLIQTQSSDELK
jgi:hypothetical protein